MSARYSLGFDIGGTFTDFVLVDSESGTVEFYKTLTTPDDPSEAIRTGIDVLMDRTGASGRDIERAIHATTLITNALIERKGARTALVTTEGFIDILDTQKEMRYDIYDLHSPPIEPLVPRPLRFGVKERMNNFGDVIRPMEQESLDTTIERLREADVEAVAVCFLHSYQNPAHEEEAGQAIKESLDDVSVSLSSEVAPEIREYERMSTVVANAYVQPLTQGYIEKLKKDLADAGYMRSLYLMLSSGGITVPETAEEFPIRLVESGPAAGALAASFFGAQLGQKDLVSFDMGGTTAKMCMIKDGEPSMAHTFEIARVHRFKRGSGLPVRIPAIELIEIGAGGGSIAWVDRMGLLKVGPLSAGASPGPACYGLGGEEPTVTDANLLLGYLNPEYFLGGDMALDVEAAEEAVEKVAQAVDLSVAEAAWGIHQIVNENMISATRVHIAERGEDPRNLTLLAFGGAGPMHAYSIAKALKMKGYVCPAGAGVASALGLLTAPVAFDFARTYTTTITQDNLPTLDQVFRDLVEEGREVLREAGVADDDMRFEFSADVRHKGQGHDIVVDLPWEDFGAIDIEQDFKPHFYETYETLYGHAHYHLDLELMTCRVRATGPQPTVNLPESPSDSPDASVALKGQRAIYLPEWKDYREVPTYDRAQLPAGARFAGPAIVEEKESTALIGPDCECRVDEHLNLVTLFNS